MPHQEIENQLHGVIICIEEDGVDIVFFIFTNVYISYLNGQPNNDFLTMF